nr:spheroidene monooxygenase [Limimaricola pyoseonensis]
MMAEARLRLWRTPGLRFWKLCGGGTRGGFTPIPNMEICAILAVWPDTAAAARGTESGVFARYAARADENWTVFMQPLSTRGRWARREPFAAGADPGRGPLAVLTRASLRPRALPRFWGHVPGVDARIAGNPDVLFRIGIGEVPFLHQVTFSIWPDAAAMIRFARGDAAHAGAVQAVRAGGWFREELYARLRVVGARGSWGGTAPLATGEVAA